MSEKKPISLLIIILTLALLCSYHIYYHFVNTVNDNLVKNYYEKEQQDNNSIKTEKINNDKNKEDYFGILTINKINLKEGFYNINSSKNNVNNSVTLLKESIMPPKRGSIIYLAAHSGEGSIAYFKNLNKLTINDIATINYNGSEYHYVINDIYEMPKNGNITVNHNINENYLVLTTCSNNKNMQIIITAKMLDRLWYNILKELDI